jgi:hypothetical protein
MPHQHSYPGDLPIQSWASYGFLHSPHPKGMRQSYDDIVHLFGQHGAVLNTSFSSTGLRFSHRNSIGTVPAETDIDRCVCQWTRLYPNDIDSLSSCNEYVIRPDDIDTHPAFQKGVISFQVDFPEGFLCQFHLSFDDPSISTAANVDYAYRWLRGPALVLSAVTDLPMRLKDVSSASLAKVCAFYRFWKNAARELRADFCCGGTYDDNEVDGTQGLCLAAFQFASGLPRWGTRPFEEERLPWKVEKDNTLLAHVWIDKCEDNPQLVHPWPSPDGPVGTMWYDRGKVNEYVRDGGAVPNPS